MRPRRASFSRSDTLYATDTEVAFVHNEHCLEEHCEERRQYFKPGSSTLCPHRDFDRQRGTPDILRYVHFKPRGGTGCLPEVSERGTSVERGPGSVSTTAEVRTADAQLQGRQSVKIPPPQGKHSSVVSSRKITFPQ